MRRMRRRRARRSRRPIKRRIRRIYTRRTRAGLPTGSAVRNTVSEQRTFIPTVSGAKVTLNPSNSTNYLNYGASADTPNFSGYRDTFNIVKDLDYALMMPVNRYEKMRIAGVKVRLTLKGPTVLSNGAEFWPTVYMATVCQEQVFQPDPTSLRFVKEFKMTKLTRPGAVATLWVPALVREQKRYAQGFMVAGDEGDLDGDDGKGIEQGGDADATGAPAGGILIDRWAKFPYVSTDDPDHRLVNFGQFAVLTDWGIQPSLGPSVSVVVGGSIQIEYRYYYKFRNLKYNAI